MNNSPQLILTLMSKNNFILPTAPLPDPLGQNIEAIITLQAKADKDLSKTQIIVEKITAFFGRPLFLYSLLLGVSLWMLVNILPQNLGIPRFDPAPFEVLDHVLGFASLLMTSGVLITQNRQEKLAEQRAQLTLQLNLLSEQKIAKLISLIEELREDLPMVKNRYDPEAEVMMQAADPHVVIEALEKTLEEDLAQLQQQDLSDS
jgi:uncharacterized membrane protein